MSYAVTLSQQLSAIAAFLGVGFLLGAAYELLRFLRRLFLGERASAVRVQDVSFCALAFFALFFSFLSFSGGVFRLHLLLFALAGFLSFRLTLGRLLRCVLDSLFQKTLRLAKAILHPFFAFSSALQSRLFYARRSFAQTLCAVRRAKRAARNIKKLKLEEK